MERGYDREKVLTPKKGMGVLLATLVGYAVAVLVAGIAMQGETTNALGIVMIVIAGAYILFGWIALLGLRIIKPQEAVVLTMFGEYLGTIRQEGFYPVHPFATAFNPAASRPTVGVGSGEDETAGATVIKTGDSPAVTITHLAYARRTFWKQLALPTSQYGCARLEART